MIIFFYEIFCIYTLSSFSKNECPENNHEFRNNNIYPKVCGEYDSISYDKIYSICRTMIREVSFVKNIIVMIFNTNNEMEIQNTKYWKKKWLYSYSEFINEADCYCSQQSVQSTYHIWG